MKPDKLPLRLMIALSGVTVAGVWTAYHHFVEPRSRDPLPPAGDARSGNAPQASWKRTLAPGSRGIRSDGSQSSTAASKVPLPPAFLGLVPGRLPENTATTAAAGSDSQSASRSPGHPAAPPPPPPPHPASAFVSKAETTAAPAEPGFRSLAAAAAQSVSGSVAEEPVVLEFADHQQLPAVLVADAQKDVTDPRQTTAQAMAARIAQEFVSEVTAPDPEPSQASGAAADPSVISGNNHADDTSDTATLPRNPATTPEQRWDDAAQVADEQYRLLVGQDEYQRKALQAAILKFQSSSSEP